MDLNGKLYQQQPRVRVSQDTQTTEAAVTVMASQYADHGENSSGLELPITFHLDPTSKAVISLCSPKPTVARLPASPLSPPQKPQYHRPGDNCPGRHEVPACTQPHPLTCLGGSPLLAGETASFPSGTQFRKPQCLSVKKRKNE